MVKKKFTLLWELADKSIQDALLTWQLKRLAEDVLRSQLQRMNKVHHLCMW